MRDLRRTRDEAKTARKLQPDPTVKSRARIALDLIGKRYLIERELRETSADERLRARQVRSVPVLAEIRAWLERILPNVLPQSPPVKAVRYTFDSWTKLTVFLEHGEVPLVSNPVENAIRPFVIGRKNWIFSHTARGATASANLYSLVETAPCRMRHGQVHAERRTMPNEGKAMSENHGADRHALAALNDFARHSPAAHRAWRNCSKRSGGRYRPLGRPFIAGTFASAASFSAI